MGLEVPGKCNSRDMEKEKHDRQKMNLRTLVHAWLSISCPQCDANNAFSIILSALSSIDVAAAAKTGLGKTLPSVELVARELAIQIKGAVQQMEQYHRTGGLSRQAGGADAQYGRCGVYCATPGG